MQAIAYDELTWTEVAALPRDVPVILPLGNGYSAEAIARALDVETVIMLPPLPYGWHDSAVSVGTDLLRRMVWRIFRAPAEEGFNRLVVVHGGRQPLDHRNIEHLKLDPDRPVETVQLAASAQRVVLISTGHVEQHGYHLPMNTDTVIINAITSGVAALIPDEAEMLPVMPYGVSTHRAEFAGTFNLGGRLYEDFMLAVVDQLAGRGADRFYLMSGHGGNCSFLVNVVKYAGERFPNTFAATTWLHTSGRIATPVVQANRKSERGGMGHAGELETAYMLHLRPDLCHMERVVDETDFIATADYYMDWTEGGALVANPPWGDDTQTGSYGAGSVATAENGALWLSAAVDEKIDHVRQIHEQQERRLAKRREPRQRSQ